MKNKFAIKLHLLLLIICVSNTAFSQAPKYSKKPITPSTNPSSAHAKTASHDDLPELCQEFGWNGTAWDSTGLVLNVYSPTGNLIEKTIYYFSSGIFFPQFKYQYTFDTNGNLTEQILQDHTGSAWENDSRQTRTYDMNQNEIEFFNYLWTNNTWEITYGNRNSYQYNASSQITEKIEESYFASSGTYVNNERTTYTFAAGVPIETTYYDWDGASWIPNNRYTNQVWFDYSKDLPQSNVYQDHDGTNFVDNQRGNWTYSQNDSYELIYDEYVAGTWTPYYKLVENYDLHGHNTLYESSSWNNGWQVSYGANATYTYDNQGITLEIVYQNRNILGVYENNSKSLYSSFFVGNSKPVQNEVDLTVYPNPASSELNFDIKMEKHGAVTITLFDMQGRKRMETLSHYNGNTLSIPISAALESGLYFYQIKAAHQFAKGKLVIQH